MKRGMVSILLENGEVFISESLNRRGKLFEGAPEFWVGAVFHKSRQRPASKSRKASSPQGIKSPGLRVFFESEIPCGGVKISEPAPKN